MNQDIMNLLREPFPFTKVEAKVQVTSGDKSKGMVVFYLDARAVQERLDKVLGPFNWKNQYITWQERAQLCGIAIYCEDRNEWVGKFDGAECSDIEPIKGGLSDSFKRAACMWGIGRYLYEMDGVWVEVEQRGKGSYVKSNQQSKLESEYNKAVAKIFGAAEQKRSAYASDSSDGSSNASKLMPTTPQGSFNEKPVTPSAPPASENTATANDRQSEATANNSSQAEFKVHSIKPSGKSSQLLELIGNSGEIITAYIKAGDQGITTGSHLKNVQMEKKSSTYGDYNLVSAYQLAA